MLLQPKPTYDAKLIQLPTVDNIRYYENSSNGERYMSVTSLLAQFPNPGIEQWASNVGEKHANAVKTVAANKGTVFHQYMQDYLSNQPVTRLTGFEHNEPWESFTKSKKELAKHIGNVYGVEVPVFSQLLKLAGTVDCLADWDSQLSIIDHKTSKSIKGEKDIENYFYQSTLYSLIVEEMFGVRASQIVINLVTPELPTPLIFKKPRKLYIPKLTVMLREKRHLLWECE